MDSARNPKYRGWSVEQIAHGGCDGGMRLNYRYNLLRLCGLYVSFGSCLFRSAVYSGNGHAAWIQIAAAAAPASTLPMAR
jgi:hypothetical protein